MCVHSVDNRCTYRTPRLVSRPLCLRNASCVMLIHCALGALHESTRAKSSFPHPPALRTKPTRDAYDRAIYPVDKRRFADDFFYIGKQAKLTKRNRQHCATCNTTQHYTFKQGATWRHPRELFREHDRQGPYHSATARFVACLPLPGRHHWRA